ncbi:methionine--tRNA ligase [Wolbachia endosymbiont of Howardula sp.]|uniref:methionine--tRNA ligase n=1 Tax=Wolbachia endosymbiont of Howardula sp. TaxID=2916816 RepID=UPI00217D938E|nr:methionine--tRNA ligase [Wolbachia endosymbiont of Howardula sp.]UWI83188.1 methionine--tRNA ligase [Wolbachia endosymbiont of Howardula sp.]
MHHSNNIYITTPIYYVNDKPHIGHAYTSLLCDVMTRFIRLSGKKVKFTTGTDEHGQKIEKAAQVRGMSPINFVNEVCISFKELARCMNIQYDDFVRTTEIRHKNAVLALWERLQVRDQIYLDYYSGWYSMRDETFYHSSELINGKAPTGAEVQWIQEESYFFRLSQWQDTLLTLYDSQPDFVFPQSRKNEVISFIKSGLTDLSISRTSFNWGIKVLDNTAHIIYVWIDALTNYLTSIGFPSTENSEYRNFWQAQDIQYMMSRDDSSMIHNTNRSFKIHIIGKDILRFHAVYWPAMLLAADLPLPNQIAVHGWWLNQEQKISKSIGNIIDPIDLVKEFGTDALRYFLLRDTNFIQDSNFSKKNMILRINSDLANNIGNLIHRTISLLHTQCYGIVPHVDQQLLHPQIDYQCIITTVMNHLTKYELHRIILLILSISSEANAYIDKNAPWTLNTTHTKTRMHIIIYQVLEYIRIIGILLQPIIPQSADKILNQLKIPYTQRDLQSLCHASIISGIKLPKSQPVFYRV